MINSFLLIITTLLSTALQYNAADAVLFSREAVGVFAQAAAKQPEINKEELTVQDRSDLSSAKKEWYFKRNKEHKPPGAQTAINLKQYDSCYLGDTSEKVIYLTFDNGYENGLTPELLDVLKEKQVPAAFFVLKSYIDKNPELIKRMADEGHIVGNHTTSHKNLSDLSGKQVEAELKGVAASYKEVTGKEMPPYFRPPSGVYSERGLAYVKDLGYKTIFWSFAYMDWEENNQPGKQKAYNMMVDNTHNGSIMLLHSVSKSNVEALPDAIDAIREQGYEFKSLDELPKFE